MNIYISHIMQCTYVQEFKSISIGPKKYSYPFYIVSYYIKRVTTSWTYIDMKIGQGLLDIEYISVLPESRIGSAGKRKINLCLSVECPPAFV